ncbi:MAG: Fic family protein [bacterium]|nr:Fic family protein [bacterium]
MNYKAFKNSKAGQLVRSEGSWAFVPNPLPPLIDYGTDLVELLTQAESDLGKLCGIGGRLANPHLLIVPYIKREAVLSSRIEGTQSTLSDLYLFEVDPEVSTRQPDVQEVANYVQAMNEGLAALNTLPLSLRLIRQIHGHLMEGVRGQDQTPGEFRRHQNYIGPLGTPIKEATFVPPPVPQMHEALNQWEWFLHAESGTSPLVECAMLQYQFEAIHPFSDGNGRVGRLFITLFLQQRGRLELPLLYLSAFFERNRSEYYERLLAVSRGGDWPGWLTFFLRGVASQSRASALHAGLILKLHENYRQRLQERRATGHTLATLDRLFRNPFVTARDIATATKTSPPTAQKIIDRLLEVEIIYETTGQTWGRIYCAGELLRTLEDIPQTDCDERPRTVAATGVTPFEMTNAQHRPRPTRFPVRSSRFERL